MSYSIITPAGSEPVTLTEVKSHLRVDHSEEDDLLAIYIKAAREYVEKYTNRIMLPTEVEEYFNDYIPCTIELRWAPVSAINSVKYIDEDLDEQTLAGADYNGDITTEPTRITPADTWPDVGGSYRVCTVNYTAGYANAAAVPANIKMAIFLLVGEMYENRENTVKRLPTAVDHLLKMEKVYL